MVSCLGCSTAGSGIASSNLEHLCLILVLNRHLIAECMGIYADPPMSQPARYTCNVHSSCDLESWRSIPNPSLADYHSRPGCLHPFFPPVYLSTINF
jgi:hypothetical protein